MPCVKPYKIISCERDKMVTSRISYSLHCDIGHPVVHELSSLRLDTKRENTMPALYVAMATWIPKCNLQHNNTYNNVDSEPAPMKPLSPLPDSEETPKQDLSTISESKKNIITPELDLKETSEQDLKETPEQDLKETPEQVLKETPEQDLKETPEQDVNTTIESKKNSSESESEEILKTDLNTTAESSIDLNITAESIDLTDASNKILNKTVEAETTAKIFLSPAQKKKQEEKLRKRQGREEQRIKERKNREEQKRREKEERGSVRRKEREEKRKEREEKEEQKRKEREEKEEQKRKERDEKDEQKRKEKEEKEEQKRKEREEKDEQRRKEREEKELKKQQEIDEKNKEIKKKELQIEKQKAVLFNFIVSRKSTDFKKQEEEKQTYAFMPFEVKSDMRVAPVTRLSLSAAQKELLSDKLSEKQVDTVLYLHEIKEGKKLGKSSQTWPIDDDNESVVLVEDLYLGERVDEEKTKVEIMRAKLFKFHENRRPAYFGTWRKKSKTINARKPLALDKQFFDYDVDSDDDWEEEEPGESLHGSDDEKEEKENENDDYEVDNDFFVPHGYLSDEEVEAEENVELSPETQKQKLKMLQDEFDEEMKSKTERIKPRLIGCIWENKLIPKVQDAIHKFLEDRMMIVTGTITIQNRDLISTNLKLSVSKQYTPNRKQLSPELIPDFLNLIHGNTTNKNSLVTQFLNYLATKESEKSVSKISLICQLKQLAKWKKCPEEGSMFNKYCWFVEEDIRNQYNLKLELPNKWTYIGNSPDEINGAKKKLVV